MTKPISKSKRQLAQLLIEAGVTQFPKGANWAAQADDKDVDFFEAKPVRELSWWQGDYDCENRISLSVKIPNWHQTVLSRDEFDQIVAETVVLSEPDSVRPTKEQLGRLDSIKASITSKLIDSVDTTDTLDHLLQDWRNADDYAQRKQTEADEAAAMRDERWQAVQARAGEIGVTVGRCDGEPKPMKLRVKKWSDLRIGDEVKCTESFAGLYEGDIGVVLKTEEPGPSGEAIQCRFDGGDYWIKKWRFIRRP